jgi:hypothetical protein
MTPRTTSQPVSLARAIVRPLGAELELQVPTLEQQSLLGEVMYRTRLIWSLSLVLLLAGCASTVKKQDGSPPVPVGTKAPGKHVVLNLTGSDATTSAKDWKGFKGIWSDECTDEFHDAEAQFSMQDGAPQPTGSEGALVVVNVVDYHYVTIGARVMLGVMTGNAFINAQVGFRDLKTGETWATKTYDTKSSAWNGVFAAMTTKQVRAMCHEILGEVSGH